MNKIKSQCDRQKPAVICEQAATQQEEQAFPPPMQHPTPVTTLANEPPRVHFEERIYFGRARDRHQEQAEALSRNAEEWAMTSRVNIEGRQQMTDEDARINQSTRATRQSSREEEENEGCANKCCCYIIWAGCWVIAIVVVLVCLRFVSGII